MIWFTDEALLQNIYLWDILSEEVGFAYLGARNR